MSIKKTKDTEEAKEEITVGELVSAMYYLKNKVDELEKENKLLKEQQEEKDKLIISLLSKGDRK